jgi:hypothetical protein
MGFPAPNNRPVLWQPPLSLQQPSPFCHPDWSEAEGRDLRFRGPFLEMFAGAYWAVIVTVTGMVCGGMQELESQAW